MRFKGRQYKPRHEWRRCRNVCERCCVFRTLLVFRKHRSLDTDNQVIADDEGRGRGGIEFTYEFQLSDINPSRCTYRGGKEEGGDGDERRGWAPFTQRFSTISVSYRRECDRWRVCLCVCITRWFEVQWKQEERRERCDGWCVSRERSTRRWALRGRTTRGSIY